LDYFDNLNVISSSFVGSLSLSLSLYIYIYIYIYIYAPKRNQILMGQALAVFQAILTECIGYSERATNVVFIQSPSPRMSRHDDMIFTVFSNWLSKL